MKYDLLIWDFNGTICDDVGLGIDCINVVLRRRGMKELCGKDEYREYFCFPIEDYYAKIGFDFSSEPYSVPALEWTNEYLARESGIEAVSGVKEALEFAKENGIKQIVLSSSEITMLRRELSILSLSDYFDDVLGLDNTFAGGKIELAKEWARGKSFKALFIGDTRHDYETAVCIGADCILFSDGHDSREHLESCPCPVVDRIEDVISYLI